MNHSSVTHECFAPLGQERFFRHMCYRPCAPLGQLIVRLALLLIYSCLSHLSNSQILKLTHYHIPRSPDHKITRSQNHQITKSQNHQITKSPNHSITRSLNALLASRFLKNFVLHATGPCNSSLKISLPHLVRRGTVLHLIVFLK